MEAAKFTGAALSELQVRLVERREEARYQAQMKNALDKAGHQTLIMSVVGHDSKRCHAQKK